MNKKPYALLMIVALTLTGCAKTTLKDDAALYTINGTSTSKQDFYTSMKSGDDGTVIINAARKDILSTLEVDETKVQVLIDENIKGIEDIFGENLLPYIQSFGFVDLEDFIAKQVRPSVIIEIKAREALDASVDTLVKDYVIKDIQFIQSSDKASIESIKAAFEAGTKLSDITLDDSMKFNEGIVSKSTEMQIKELAKYVSSDQAIGLSEVIYDEESNIYFIVDNRLLEDEETIINSVLNNENYINNYSATLFKELGFKVYDKDLLAKMKLSFPDYVN